MGRLWWLEMARVSVQIDRRRQAVLLHLALPRPLPAATPLSLSLHLARCRRRQGLFGRAVSALDFAEVRKACGVVERPCVA